MNRFKKNYRAYILVFIGWLLLGLIILLFGQGMAEGLSVWEFVQLYGTYFFLFLLILYLNSLVLLPRLYYAHRKAVYFVVLVVLASLVVFYFKPFDSLVQQLRYKTRPYWEKKFMKEIKRRNDSRDSLSMDFNRFPGERRVHMPDARPAPPFPRYDGRPDLVGLLIFFFLIGSSLAIESSRRLAKSEQKRLLAEAEKTKAELAFLKAQVNPHFLFNTLNNIYSMSLVQKEETPDAIMRLSNIMRYVTDSSGIEYIGLEDELKFIDDYIFLNKLKGGRQLEIAYRLEGDPDGKEIAPLLLISFIENAFKYGISKRGKSPIRIQIAITDHWLKMVVTNKVILSKDKMTENTGVGIGNTKKRLDTLYAGKYRLDIVDANGEFQVALEIPLVIKLRHEN